MANENFRQIVRIVNNDLKGNLHLWIGLSKVKGISFNLAKTICRVADIDEDKKIGYLTNDEVNKINDTVTNLAKLVPPWLLNLRKDAETGEDYHLVNTDLIFKHDQILRKYKKLKNYRGIRHAYHLPVRGQRTKSNFRPSKSRNKRSKKSKR
ncbi:MAG: 30S ribosomal protein S13 [Nitrospiraceae bacterium]|nr:30S ribosomal protein S13 [Nitrospiraceae bacterium]